MAKELTAEEREDRDRRAAEKIKARQKADRDRAESEREEHRKAVAEKAEQDRTELEMVMEELPEAERRQVRLQAYLTLKNSQWGTPHNKQEAVDQIALELARYMTTGVV